MPTLQAFPTLDRFHPSEFEWWPIVNAYKHEADATGSVDMLEIVGTKWGFSALYRNLLRADRALVEAWLSAIGTIAGLFTYSHPSYAVPRGTARGTGTTVGAAAQFATSITLSGASIPNGSTLLAADFIEVNVAGQAPLLLRATADATAAAGSITVPVKPMLRIAVPNGTAFTLVSPKGQFRLTTEKPSIPLRPGGTGQAVGDFRFDAIEDWSV